MVQTREVQHEIAVERRVGNLCLIRGVNLDGDGINTELCSPSIDRGQIAPGHRDPSAFLLPGEQGNGRLGHTARRPQHEHVHGSGLPLR